MRRRCAKRWCFRSAESMRLWCPKHKMRPEDYADVIARAKANPPFYSRLPGESALDQKRRTGVISGIGPPPKFPPPKASRL